MFNLLNNKKWIVLNALLIGILVSLLGVQVTNTSIAGTSIVSTNDFADRSIRIGIGNEKVITLGHVSYAAGSVDYTYDGVADNVQFQAALDALPATGGRIVDVSAVQKNFAATVTRAIPNVTIEGSGYGSYFVNNGITALFTAGGNGWTFSAVRTDAGGINMGATTGWLWIKVNNGVTAYDWRTPAGSVVNGAYIASSITDSGLTNGRIPVASAGGLLGDDADLTFSGGNTLNAANVNTSSVTDSSLTDGRIPIAGAGGLLGDDGDLTWSGGNTLNAANANVTGTLDAAVGRGAYIVAATDGPALWKLQADAVADGTSDEVEIEAGFAAGYKEVFLTPGTFTISDDIDITGNGSKLAAIFGSTTIKIVDAHNAAINMIHLDAANNVNLTEVTISGLILDGNRDAQAGGAQNGITFDHDGTGVIKDSRIDNNIIKNLRIYAIYDDTGTNNWITNNYFLDNTLAGATDGSIYSRSSAYEKINYNHISGFQVPAITFYTANANEAIGNTIISPSRTNLYNGVYIWKGSRNIVSENFISTAWYGVSVGGDALATNYSQMVVNNITSNCEFGIVADYSEQSIFSNNHIYNSYEDGIHMENSNTNANITGNKINIAGLGANNTYYGMYLENNIDSLVDGNSVEMGAGNKVKNGLYIRGGSSARNQVKSNYLEGNTSPFDVADDTTSTYYNNRGYIAPGEARSVSGSLTSGNATAIAFSWHNPEAQDIYVTKVVIAITTAGGTPASLLDVGIADDAAGTNRGTEFFNDIDLNATAVVDSLVAAGGGTQTVWVLCQDSASATDGWVVGQILDQNAASLVGKYYIEYVGV